MKIHWYDCLCTILYNSSKYGLPDEFVKNAFVNLLSGCHLFPSVKRDLCFQSGVEESITEKVNYCSKLCIVIKLIAIAISLKYESSAFLKWSLL